METKELKVVAPEGYEIDKENSTFECIKFKLIKKELTYEGIANSLMKNELYYITTAGCIGRSLDNTSRRKDPNNATNEEQLDRILALNQLINIAEYYNRKAERGDKVHVIMYNMDGQAYEVDFYALNVGCQYGALALFNREEDAQAVIDNPNFKEILDRIYKR